MNNIDIILFLIFILIIIVSVLCIHYVPYFNDNDRD